MSDMRRREFIALLGGAAGAWPLAAPAEQGGGTLPIGQLIPANRMTDWSKPGMTAKGGIPHRTTVYKTLSPLGGEQDDDPQIQAAINSCPKGQVVQLTAGVFRINGGEGWRGVVMRSNITLRGVGPGQGLNTGINGVNTGQRTYGVYTPDPTATQLIKINQLGPTAPITLMGADPSQGFTSFNLAADAIEGTYSLTLVSNPGIRVGEILLIDQVTNDHPDVWWGANDPPGGGSRRWFARQDRSLSQIMEVTAVNGDTITFATPFHCTFRTIYSAQLSRYVMPWITGAGIEDLFVFGDLHGSGIIAMNGAAYCWVKHVEAAWFDGHAIGLTACYRCEVRDSYFHESANPNPGGGGYIIDMTTASSDNLIENIISWFGNKVITMRCTGGGNVIAYNYMDDAFGGNYPDLPEAGVNCGHHTTSHMELVEGNWSHEFKGDSYWGNSIDITVFRNHLTGLRSAHPPLNTYKSSYKPYIDMGGATGRNAVDIQAHSYRQNLVGNVLGFQGQTLLSYHGRGYNAAQTGWAYETISGFPAGGIVSMWVMGSNQVGSWSWVPDTYLTQLREGNWDWVTKSQRWHGIGGTGASTGTPKTIPNSMYLSSKPAFFGSNPWPWVDPVTGAVYTLPAKARFDAGTPNG